MDMGIFLQKVIDALSKSILAQNHYGKKKEDLPILAKIMADDILKVEDNLEEILEAFELQRINSPNFPTVSDILDILSPKFKYSLETYKAIRQKLIDGNVFVSDYQKQYLKNYEGWSTDGQAEPLRKFRARKDEVKAIENKPVALSKYKIETEERGWLKDGNEIGVNIKSFE